MGILQINDEFHSRHRGILRNRWWVVAIASSVVGVAAVALGLSESEAAQKKRIEETKKKELRAIANRISHYAKFVRERFPDGAVVVSEEDLAADQNRRDLITKGLTESKQPTMQS